MSRYTRRKQRELEELRTDPYFDFYVGRLVGASEVTSNWMQLQSDQTAKEMGRSLSVVVAWFFTREATSPQAILAPDKVDTKVIPPATRRDFP